MTGSPASSQGRAVNLDSEVKTTMSTRNNILVLVIALGISVQSTAFAGEAGMYTAKDDKECAGEITLGVPLYDQ